ncbi:WcaI family glycosyltransferase [Phenylobacterium sp. J367]|uniref:WcaI family glycosyltransferase n=1 Tax=Phenylobacterium sp. J367 TaxID=2898435 RepID=UPI002151C39F|nr:WcaI family glycosyltransferase [Phenylobacterium sp. J367]MCR5879511.1 WcaI family glycosyltransferase [Phenylobacterium sp. J367]
MKQRVVIYGMNYAPELAGVGRYTGEIGEHLAAQGHEVAVVTTPPHYPGWRVQAGHSARSWTVRQVAGATVIRCPIYLHAGMRGFRRLFAPLSFALSSAPVAIWHALKRRPDVVIAVEPTLFVAPVALLAARLVGARTVLHIQDLEVEAAFAMGHLSGGGVLSRIAAAFDRWAVRRFDRIVTISERMAEKVRAKGVARSRVEVVRNWVDLSKIHPDLDGGAYRQELGLRTDQFAVLYSGNLGAKQGVGVLAEAAKRLSHRDDIVFVIAGDGPMRRDLEDAAQALPNLRVLPLQPEARFGTFLASADLHVLPQERDAADLLLPSKLGGMLASGKRILVTADPGTELTDFLGDSCAFSPPGDGQALADAIAALAAEPPALSSAASA